MSKSDPSNSTNTAIPQLPALPLYANLSQSQIISHRPHPSSQMQPVRHPAPTQRGNPMQYQQSASSTTSSLTSNGITEVVVKFKAFINSYENQSASDTFDHQKWGSVFTKLLDKLKETLDPMNEPTLKECEKMISPLLCQLICETVPPNLGPAHDTNGGGEEKERVDIKMAIVDWLKHDKFVHIMEMQHVERVLRHCVDHENESITISWYESIVITKLMNIRSKYKQWKQKYSSARRQQNDTRALLPMLPGKMLFDYITGGQLLPFLTPMTLLIQILKRITKRLQNPLEWIKKLYAPKGLDSNPPTKFHAQALEGHLFTSVPLQQLKYLYWIVEIAVDVNDYYKTYIAPSKDPKLENIRIAANGPEFTAFITECSEMKVIFHFLEAVIGIYGITDDQLSSNGIVPLKGSHDPITKIRTQWLALITSAVHYMYQGWGQFSVNQSAGSHKQDASHWQSLKEWEKVHIPGVINVTLEHHIESMRKTRSNQEYCKFLKVIAQKCTALASFCSLMARDHFGSFCDRSRYLGDHESTTYCPRTSYGALCLHENILMKSNIEFWFYCMVCSFWIHICPTSNSRTWQYKDFQFYCVSDAPTKCAIFEFEHIGQSLTILLSVLRNERCSMHLQEYAAQALTAVIRFVQLFEAQYIGKTPSMLIDIYRTFDAVKWTLEGKLEDIDLEMDQLFKLLHVRQYDKQCRLRQQRGQRRKTRKRKRSECESTAKEKVMGTEASHKRRKMMMDVDDEKEERANGMEMEMDVDDNDDENRNKAVVQEDGEEEMSDGRLPPMEWWMNGDYAANAKKDITTTGVVEVDKEVVQVDMDQRSNPEWMLYETEYLMSLIFRVIRYIRNHFEHDFVSKCKQHKVTVPEGHRNVYSDRDIHRCSKVFATHLRLLRIYAVPQRILPQLHIKTKEEVLDQGLHQFMRQLTPQQARSVWTTNMELLMHLAEAYPHCHLFGLALRNCCKTASTLITQMQSQSQSRRPPSNVEHQNHAAKSFIACDAYLGYLSANLESLLGDDGNENILLSHFDGDTTINQHEAVQFIERHFFQSVPPQEYYRKFNNVSKGYGFTMYHDALCKKWHRIPTFNGFILPPFVEEERFAMFSLKYLEYKRYCAANGGGTKKTSSLDDETMRDMVSYLDKMDDADIKDIASKYRVKCNEYASTRWVQLDRHDWIIDTTEHVIRCLFKLFMQIHQVQYPPQGRNQNVVNHGWKQLPKLYGDAQAMITHYAKELIFKCITLSFKTSHCLPYIRLLQQIMTKCIENQFVGLLVPHTNFIVPSLVSLADSRSLRYNTNLSHFEHESDHSPYKIVSRIPREFEAILCKASECSLIVTSDTTPMQLPFIQQLMVPILHGLKLENEGKYPHLMKKALYALNLWFDSLTVPSIESLLHDHGDALCRALCLIIQKSTSDSFKKQAIRALGKLGGNNRQFLERPSSMKHEGSTARCISLDFSISNDNVPNMIDLSFSNLIDEALNVVIEDPISRKSSFDQQNANQRKKRISAMETVRALLTTLVWNEDDYKFNDAPYKEMLNAFGTAQSATPPTGSNETGKVEEPPLPPLRVPIPFCEKIHLLKNFDFEGQPTADSKADFDPNPVAPGETVENYKSFGHQEQIKISEEKLKTAIMAVIIAAANDGMDDEFQTAQNRDFRSSLSRHFGLLFATQPIQEFQTEQDKEQIIYIPMQSSKYLSNHLHCDLYLEAMVTVLMAQNLQWKHSANCALIEFLDTIDSVCSHLHRHSQFQANNNLMVCDDQQQELFNQEKVLELQTKKLSIITRHVLKLLEHHVINNTDSVLDGVVMGLTCIGFKIAEKPQVLTWELIEQFLMTAVKAARFTFVERNDSRRHEHLSQLMHYFLERIYRTLDEYYRVKDHRNAQYKSASDVLKRLGCMVTKMHLVPIGSRELMYKIMDDIATLIGLPFSEFIPKQQLIDGLLKNGGDPNDKKAPSRLCGFFETASWAASTTPPILALDENIKPFMNHAVHELALILQPEKQAFLSVNPQDRTDPIAKAMEVFLQKVEDYSAHVRTQKVMASIRFMSCALTSPFWLKVTPKMPDRNGQYDAPTTKWHVITRLVELLISADDALFDAAFAALQRLHQHGTTLDATGLVKNQIVSHCLSAMEKFNSCADPVKIRVIESFYRLFGSECIKQKYGTRLVVLFKEWLRHYSLSTKSCHDAEIPVLMASFFEHIPESKADDDEVAEVDPKTSRPLTCTDRIMDTSITVITEFERRQLWPYISSYVKNSCDTINPLHRSIVPFFNKHPSKTIEYFLREIDKMVVSMKNESNTKSNGVSANNVDNKSKHNVTDNDNDTNMQSVRGLNAKPLIVDRQQFYKQQLFQSILSLEESEPVRRQFRDRTTLQYVVDRFVNSPVLVQSNLVRILVEIGRFDKGWLHSICPNPSDGVLAPILKSFEVHLDDIGRNVVQFEPGIMSLVHRIVQMLVFGYDYHLNATTIAILSQCFGKLSFVSFAFFERFLNETLPQKLTVLERQTMILRLSTMVLDQCLNPKPDSSAPNSLDVLPILQYAIRGIVEGDISGKRHQETIWSAKEWELPKYLVSRIMDNDSIFGLEESIRAELIGLIYDLMRQCDPEWFQSTPINSFLWKIFKNKVSGSSTIGIASQLTACCALLRFANFFGDMVFLNKIGEVLGKILKNCHQLCTDHFMLIQSIFSQYIGLQIRARKKETAVNVNLNAWLSHFICEILDLQTLNQSGTNKHDVIWKAVIYAFLQHRESLSIYWSNVFLFYRSFFRCVHKNEQTAAMSVSYRKAVLDSIRVLSQWIRRHPAQLQQGKQQKLGELYGYAHRFVLQSIQIPSRQIYNGTNLVIPDYHNAALLNQYAAVSAHELALVSQEACKTMLTANFNTLQNQMWFYAASCRVMDASSRNMMCNAYVFAGRTVTVLRTINAVLTPKPDDPRTMKRLCEMFSRYDYDKVVEYWTSISLSIPVQLDVYEQLSNNKKAAFHHSKYLRFDYNAEDHSKVAKMEVFMDCDAIYFEELTNLIGRVAALAEYLSRTKFADQDNRNGKRIWSALRELQLHHAWDTKIWSQLQKLWKDYKAQLNMHNGEDQRAVAQRRHAKLVVVLNCQLFRLWEPMMKYSLIGRSKTVVLLSYLCEFGTIIMEDYQLRIRRLIRLIAMEASCDTVASWEQHLKVIYIPLLRAIAKIVCINCRECVKERKLPKPSDPSSGSSRHHHSYPEVVQRTFYQHFVDLFGALFQMDCGSQSCTIHLDLLHHIGSLVVEHFIKNDLFQEIDLKMKLIESMRTVFSKHLRLRDIYVEAVMYILEGVQSKKINDSIIPQPIYMVHDITELQNENSMFVDDEDSDLTSAHFVRSFLTCLCLPDLRHRSRFREYMRQEIGRTLFERLRLVYGGADWIEIGDKFWITPGLDLVLDLFDGDANVHLHHPDAKSLQSMKYYEPHGNNSTRLMDLTEVDPLRDVARFETKMLYRRSALRASAVLRPLVEWMYCSPRVTQNVWLQVIVPITEKFDVLQHKQLLDSLHSMLLIDTDIGFEAYHLSNDEEHQCCDPLQTVMKGVSFNAPSPFPDFGWNIIARCAYYHCCWFECLDIVNNYLHQILSVPEHSTKYRAKHGVDPIETREFKLVADLFDDLYTQIGADDICTSFWKTRSTNPATQCALTLKQFSYWDRVQHQLYRVQTRYFKKTRKTSKVAEAECRLWQKDWLVACKKLGHWSILEQRANDQKIPSYQLEAQCHAGTWSEFNKLLPFHDEAEDDPDHCRFEAYLYQLYHHLSKSIAPEGFMGDELQSQQNGHHHQSSHHQYRQLHQQQLQGMTVKTRKVLDIVSNAMPRNIARGFRKFPEFISSIHRKLLHDTHLFVEIEEGIESLEMTRKRCCVERMTEHEKLKLDEHTKKTINRWRQRLPNVYDGLDIWHDVFSWRVNCFEFGAYFQKQPERNNLMFHDKAWTIIQLSKHGRTQNCYNSALLILSKIMSMKRMDARDFYLRIKEQVAIAKMNVNDNGFKSHIGIHHGAGNRNHADSKDGSNPMNRKASSIRRALHILNIASLKWFTELQKSELFSIKAEIKQKLSELDDSNASYSASLAIAGDNWRAWTKWGDFCDSIYLAKFDYRWAMYAMISYLCSLHGGDELTRAYWPDNLMNPIHPNSKSNQSRAGYQHQVFGRNYPSHSDEVLQKHGDPEKDLQHSNYHHLVIPRILMLVQAARLGPEDKNDGKKEERNGDGNGSGEPLVPPHVNENNEEKTIPTKENSEFIRYLYDGVMKLPPHVFLGYIPQLISGLYRYETDACFLILKDHISFIAPQYLFYYLHHYKSTHEVNLLHQTARKCKAYAHQHQFSASKLERDMQSVHDPDQKRKYEHEIQNVRVRGAQIQQQLKLAQKVRSVMESQPSYQKMMKIQSNLMNRTSYKLQSIINEQRDLIPRLRQFGNDVVQRKSVRCMKLMDFLGTLRRILNDILAHNPGVGTANKEAAHGLDFGNFVLQQSRCVYTMLRLWQRILNYAKNEEENKSKPGFGALERYYNQFNVDFKWFLELKEDADRKAGAGQGAGNSTGGIVRRLLNETDMETQFRQKDKLFEKAFEWLKHITFRVGIVERSLSKLKALYGSDLNFYEPSQAIFCPGYIGKTLFRRRPRADNLPHSKSGHHRQDVHLWSMDAPNIIRIAPKLFLLPQTLKEFYILCNDGKVRSYRMKDNQKEGRLRQIREQQLTKFCNELFRSNAETRRRALCCNSIANVVPMDLQTTFYEFNRNEVSFERIVDAHCIGSNSDQIGALHSYSKHLHQKILETRRKQRDQHQPVDVANQEANLKKQGLFRTVQKEYFPPNILDDFVAKSLIGSSFKVHSTTAEFFEFKRRFAKSLAFHNLWLMCWRTERRDLASYFLRMDTGELICRGDFGTSMHIFDSKTVQIPPPHHDFPFRVTPNLHHFLSPNLMDAHLTVSLSAMASVMGNPKEDCKDDCLRHFLYIHFREAKLEFFRRKSFNNTQLILSGATNNNHGNQTLYQLCDRQLLNQDFKWMKQLDNHSAHIAQKIKTLSYPVFAEPPFSFKSYDLSKDSPTQSQRGVLDAQDAKYIEPINRVTQMVDDAKSIKVVCEMPPSWNPFF